MWKGVRLEILKVSRKGRKIKKYSRLDGMDERLEILNVTWKGYTIRNTQGLVEGMQDQK